MYTSWDSEGRNVSVFTTPTATTAFFGQILTYLCEPNFPSLVAPTDLERGRKTKSTEKEREITQQKTVAHQSENFEKYIRIYNNDNNRYRKELFDFSSFHH